MKTDFSKKEEQAIYDLLHLKACDRFLVNQDRVSSLKGDVVYFLRRFSFDRFAFNFSSECFERLSKDLKIRLKAEWEFLVQNNFVRLLKPFKGSLSPGFPRSTGVFGYTSKLVKYKFQHLEKPSWMIERLSMKVKIPKRKSMPKGWICPGPEA